MIKTLFESAQLIGIQILAILGALIVFANFAEKLFGIDKVGTRLYKLFPSFWRFIMRGSIERKEMRVKMDQMLTEIHEVKKEVKYNNGSSLKDITRSLHDNVDTNIALNHKLTAIITLNTLRLDLIDEASHRMLFRLDKDGKCFFVNDSFLKELGYTERDIEGFSWQGIVHPDDRQEFERKLTKAIEKKSKLVSTQRIMTAEGKTVNCKIVAYPLVEDEELREFYAMIDEIIY